MNKKAFFTLPLISQLSQSVSLRRHNGLDFLIMQHKKMSAVLSLQGAQLLNWQPQATQEPIIWLSEKSYFAQNKAIRGGIPLCWPWFGKVAEPAHGFARVTLWNLTSLNEDDDHIHLVLTMCENPKTLTIWPYPFTINLHLRLGEDCMILLEFEGVYQATAALHSYFHVADIHQIHVTGLGHYYLDKTVPLSQTVYDKSDFYFKVECVDRIYTHPQKTTYIHDPVLKRIIKIQHLYHSNVVVWNPGQEASLTMSDMTPDGYRSLLCIETARINQPFLLKKQNSVARLGAIIKYQPI